MNIHGQDVQLEKRQCKMCPATFRVMTTSKQRHCGKICEARDTGADMKHYWSFESSYVVRPPKDGIFKLEDE